ncbi:unnamed protein product [Symbiodinium natans]|uniref:Uncharacterized protein n=1 Tax=Symbiodinium natans TaxID=878477 RepID=A0A812I0U3_9DINO|nr:unnamed protein product [Symbiodinium natans]
MAFSGFAAQPVQLDPRFRYAAAPETIVMQPEMTMTWWMPSGYTYQDKAQTQQQVLKLQELIRFEGPTEPKADALEVSLNVIDSDIAWEPKKDVGEVLFTLSQIAGTCEVASLVSGLHYMAKLSEQDAYGVMGGLENVLHDPRLANVLLVFRSKAHGVTTSRAIMRAIWALGKLGVRGKEVQGIIAELAQTSLPIISQFSCQELSNTLWGLARLSESLYGLMPEGTQLAYSVMMQSTTRLAQFSTQCLTNSLWAVAKLGLKGNECLFYIKEVMFREMSPQGLANSLWACAKLQSEPRAANLAVEAVKLFCRDAARRTRASENLLEMFFPQELSMALWAMAKLMGRRPRFKSKDDCFQDVWRFAESVASEAASRICDFSPQGVSTIAWSLATLDVMNGAEALYFFEVAAQVATLNIKAYPPQAIANCCWAFNRLSQKGYAIEYFGRVAADEALRRIDEFSWQDCSGIVSALMNTTPQSSMEVRLLAEEVVIRARSHCKKIGTQALLNIALSGVRLKVALEVMTPLVYEIGQAFDGHMHNLNEIDLRQWEEVQRYCHIHVPGSTAGKSREWKSGRGRRGK